MTRGSALARDITPAAARPDPAAQRPALLMSLAILLVVIATFGRCVRYPFLSWDDHYHVIDNPHFNPPTINSTLWFWTHEYGNLYAPLSYTVFAVEVALSGSDSIENLSPILFHVVQILLHAGSAVIVFLILRRLFPDALFAAMCGALIFALHPLQVESVVWISELRGILAGFLGIASLLLLLRWNRVPATIAFALALCAKPSAVCLPVIAMALIRFIPRERRRAYSISIAPWFVLAIAMMFVTQAVQKSETIPLHAAWISRPIVALDAIAFYIWKIILPISLSADYGRTPDAVLNGITSRWIWILPIVLAALLVIRRRDAKVSAGILAFLAALLPVLGFAAFHYQIISTVADRYAYLPMLGVAIVVAGIVSRVRFATIPALSLAIILGALSIHQTGFWQSDEMLWTRAAHVTPRSDVALNNLGYAQYQNGKLDEAIDSYRAAIALDKSSQTAPANLRDVLADKEVRDSREEHSAADWIRLGDIQSAGGQLDLAGACYRKAISLDPKNGPAINNLGLTRLRQGRFHEAIAALRKSVVLMPENQSARANLLNAEKLLAKERSTTSPTK